MGSSRWAERTYLWWIVPLALGTGLVVTALLYLGWPIPVWDLLFRPGPGQDEGPAEWRLLWFSLAGGALVAAGMVIAAVKR